MTFVIPSASNFHCIKNSQPPSGNKYAQGFFMYRWSTKNEAESQKVNSDDLGDINPYYLLTELMTNLGNHPPASKAGGCTIPKCGENPQEGGCVLERIYVEMNNAAAQDLLINGGIWGQYMAVDNGIPSEYAYWAWNWTGHNPNQCKEDQFTPDCNFFFNGGYPVGCQAKSDVVDKPVWYSTIAACPQYPFNPNSQYPRKMSDNFTWHAKLDESDEAVRECNREMPGGSYCLGIDNETHLPKGSPWATGSKTCTWMAKNAGYLTVEDIFNIPQPLKYTEWCKQQLDNITGYGSGTGIPWNITLFYNLSEIAFPVLKEVNSSMWHEAVSSDRNQLSKAQKAVFQNWAKWAKVRLDAMFAEMDKQAFAEFNRTNTTDPSGKKYEHCLSNLDVVTPPCKDGLSEVQETPLTFAI